jgi:hypothetical protein
MINTSEVINMGFRTKREAKEIADSLGLSVYKGMNGKWYME